MDVTSREKRRRDKRRGEAFARRRRRLGRQPTAGTPQAYPQWIWAAAAAAVALILFLLLRPAFSGQWYVSPVVFAAGPLSVRWYGLLIALAFVPGYFLAGAEARRKGISSEAVLDFILLAALFGFVGARLGYVVQNLDIFLAEPLRIPAVWEGGLSMHGVMVGGVLAAYLFTRRRKIPFLTFVDVTVVSLLLGQAIGRWGNFFNQELFGYPTQVPWKMYIRPENRPPDLAEAAFFHPTFLYESLWNFAALGFLLWFRRQPQSREGDIFFMYFVTYSLGRFWVEFFRIGQPVAAGLTLAQLVSLLLMAAGMAAILIRRESRPLKEVTGEQALHQS